MCSESLHNMVIVNMVALQRTKLAKVLLLWYAMVIVNMALQKPKLAKVLFLSFGDQDSRTPVASVKSCLLYTSDAADES